MRKVVRFGSGQPVELLDATPPGVCRYCVGVLVLRVCESRGFHAWKCFAKVDNLTNGAMETLEP